MNVNDSDLLLAGLGLFIGFITTSPLELRHRRLFHMVLVPVLLVGMRQLIPGGQDVAANLAGFTGFWRSCLPRAWVGSSAGRW